MNVEISEGLRKNLLCGAVGFLCGIALGLWLGIGGGENVPNNGIGIDAIRGELERAVERERRAAGEAHELAGEADSLGDEIGSVREELEDAQREAGLALEGTDRASVLIGECQSIVERVRAGGEAEAAEN